MHLLKLTGLLLLISARVWCRRHEILVAVSDDVTVWFGPCDYNHVSRIYYNSLPSFINCNDKDRIQDRFQGRSSVNETAGSFIIHNVTKSDAGYYKIVRTDANGYRKTVYEADVKVLDKVRIHSLSRNDTNSSLSLRVVCAGDLEAITWTMDGGDLPDGHWLSEDNRTLTVPYNVTAKFTVLISNRVSEERKDITVVKDLHDKGGYLSRVMTPNINKVLWYEGDGTLLLRRDVTDIYVVAKSEEPEEYILKSRGHFGLYAVLIVTIPIIVVLMMVINGNAQGGGAGPGPRITAGGSSVGCEVSGCLYPWRKEDFH